MIFIEMARRIKNDEEKDTHNVTKKQMKRKKMYEGNREQK